LLCQLEIADLASIVAVVNDAAQAYKGVIPADCWKEPYITIQELESEWTAGIKFYGWKIQGSFVGVMGIQRVKDVTLIRHAYVLAAEQRKGVGQKLLNHLINLADTEQVLVGTWTAAWWAVHFYEKNGFRIIPKKCRSRLRQYWTIPDRQAETSVVLGLEK
jgi:GNAT superfamily N-acetyltransferase